MGQVIRVGLIIVAVVAIIALLVPITEKVVEALPVLGQHLSSAINSLSPYLLWGRQLLNALVGVPILVDIMLWFVLLSPIALHAAAFTIKIFRKVIG